MKYKNLENLYLYRKYDNRKGKKMKKRLCTIGCILAASVMMFGGCASGNSKTESKENASSQSEASEATESKEGKRSSDFTTDYTYPGTKSGFVLLDFFMNEKGETKQDVSLAHLGPIKDITADDILELAADESEYDDSLLDVEANSFEDSSLEPVDECEDWPSISFVAYHTKDMNWSQIRRELIKEDMWTLMTARTSGSITGSSSIPLTSSTIYQNGEPQNPDEAVEKVEVTPEYLGKPTTATLFVSESDGKVCYDMYVCWKIGENVVYTEFTGQCYDDIQLIDSWPIYVTTEKGYKEEMQDKYDDAESNKQTTYDFTF